MTLTDYILLIFLLMGVLLGFKKGAIKSLVALIGTIAVVVISYLLKDILAEVLFKYVPFLNFTGEWEGLVTLNILIYEAIAFLIIFIALSSILSILLKISGIIEKILKFTIILGIPSKLIGAVLGFLEALIFSFIALFVLVQFNGTNKYIIDSNVAGLIINKTPFIGNMVNDTYDAIKEINELNKSYKENKDVDHQNREIFNIMLNYKVITPELAQELINNNKLDFAGAQTILDTYKEENNG